MAISERQRRQYNKDCAAIEQLQKDVRFTGGAAKRSATERLKAAWIAFDEEWNERTPTEAQMALWLDAMSK